MWVSFRGASISDVSKKGDMFNGSKTVVHLQAELGQKLLF